MNDVAGAIDGLATTQPVATHDTNRNEVSARTADQRALAAVTSNLAVAEGPSEDVDPTLPTGVSSEAAQGAAGGGCDARALVQLGVFADEWQAMHALNLEIDVLWEELKKANPAMPRQAVGVNDVEWHKAIMPRVCEARGFSVKKLPPGASLNGDAKYFVDGYVNTMYKRGQKWHTISIEGCNEKSLAAKKNRRHSTAVVNGKVRDHPAWILHGQMPMKCLKYATGKRKRQAGFMTEICAVYRVSTFSQLEIESRKRQRERISYLRALHKDKDECRKVHEEVSKTHKEVRELQKEFGLEPNKVMDLKVSDVLAMLRKLESGIEAMISFLQNRRD